MAFKGKLTISRKRTKNWKQTIVILEQNERRIWRRSISWIGRKKFIKMTSRLWKKSSKTNRSRRNNTKTTTCKSSLMQSKHRSKRGLNLNTSKFLRYNSAWVSQLKSLRSNRNMKSLSKMKIYKRSRIHPSYSLINKLSKKFQPTSKISSKNSHTLKSTYRRYQKSPTWNSSLRIVF